MQISLVLFIQGTDFLPKKFINEYYQPCFFLLFKQ